MDDPVDPLRQQFEDLVARVDADVDTASGFRSLQQRSAGRRRSRGWIAAAAAAAVLLGGVAGAAYLRSDDTVVSTDSDRSTDGYPSDWCGGPNQFQVDVNALFTADDRAAAPEAIRRFGGVAQLPTEKLFERLAAEDEFDQPSDPAERPGGFFYVTFDEEVDPDTLSRNIETLDGVTKVSRIRWPCGAPDEFSRGSYWIDLDGQPINSSVVYSAGQQLLDSSGSPNLDDFPMEFDQRLASSVVTTELLAAHGRANAAPVSRPEVERAIRDLSPNLYSPELGREVSTEEALEDESIRRTTRLVLERSSGLTEVIDSGDPARTPLERLRDFLAQQLASMEVSVITPTGAVPNDILVSRSELITPGPFTGEGTTNDLATTSTTMP